MAAKVYLVGGAVRDMLLGHPVKDKDWVVVGATPQEMLDQGYTQVGADFPVFLHPTTKEEYALARTERKTAAGYHGFETDYSTDVTLEQDLERRDLTINAMAIAAEDVMTYKMNGDAQLLVDPFKGATDLEAGLLRHVSPAFAEDPVRILRVARFAARYDFTVHSDTVFHMQKMMDAGEVDSLVPERVWTEFEKAITEPHAEKFFEVLDSVRALEKVLPFFGVQTGQHAMDICKEFTSEMAMRHRAAAIFIMAIVHLPGETHENRRAAYYDECRVPSGVSKLVEQVMHIAQNDTLRGGKAADWLATLKQLGWYRDDTLVHEVGRVLPPYKSTDVAGMYNRLVEAWQVSCRVAFADLSDEQKATLKGPAVGAAIDALRLEKLKKLEFKEKLRG